MMRPRAAKRGEGGQALVEFSLVGIVFFLLVFGMIDVGRAAWNYNTLAQATREGTRYAIVHGADSFDPSGPGSAYYTSPPSSDTKITAVVEKFAGGLNLSKLNVEAEWLDSTNDAGNRVKVTTEYGFEPIFDFLFPDTIFDLMMTSSSTMEITN